MKLFWILATVVLSGFSASALGCPAGQKEAQFIGKIAGLDYSGGEAGNLDHYTYRIQFVRFQPSMDCPLNDQEAAAASFWVQGSPDSVQNGDLVSGVLVYNSNTNTYYIQ